MYTVILCVKAIRLCSSRSQTKLTVREKMTAHQVWGTVHQQGAAVCFKKLSREWKWEQDHAGNEMLHMTCTVYKTTALEWIRLPKIVLRQLPKSWYTTMNKNSLPWHRKANPYHTQELNTGCMKVWVTDFHIFVRLHQPTDCPASAVDTRSSMRTVTFSSTNSSADYLQVNISGLSPSQYLCFT